MIVAAQDLRRPKARMFVPGSTRPTDIAKAIVERGAEINAQAKNGMTALMVAAAHNNPPMIGLLMDAGADPTLKNKQGQTAARRGREERQSRGAPRPFWSWAPHVRQRLPAPAGSGAETTSK